MAPAQGAVSPALGASTSSTLRAGTHEQDACRRRDPPAGRQQHQRCNMTLPLSAQHASAAPPVLEKTGGAALEMAPALWRGNLPRCDPACGLEMAPAQGGILPISRAWRFNNIDRCGDGPASEMHEMHAAGEILPLAFSAVHQRCNFAAPGQNPRARCAAVRRCTLAVNRRDSPAGRQQR
ncbi:hypothetical protein T484DRAFT_1747023 [Baffinella frigidus]|nr:hypothetical protein T484DRAFT_1747023 [Cryptophyta sp. CCMP2293]